MIVAIESKGAFAPSSRQRGVALVLALWLTVLLTVLATTFAFSMRNEALAARNAVSSAQARAIADGAIERMAFELSRPRLPDSWMADGLPHSWTDGEATVTASAVDEGARIDLNVAPDPLLKSLLMVVGGADDPTAAMLVDRIVDWRDLDDQKRPNGAEEADYRGAGSKYRPGNAPFEAVSDLTRVLGMTMEVYERIAPTLTVFSRQPGVNSQTATRTVLLALPGVTVEQVDAYLQQRKEAQANKLPIPVFPGAQGFAGGAIQVWRVHAEAALPDGVTFAREAVLRPSGDARRPFVTLAWAEALRLPAPEPATGAPKAP
jgi:general secretion pathway protein K